MRYSSAPPSLPASAELERSGCSMSSQGLYLIAVAVSVDSADASALVMVWVSAAPDTSLCVCVCARARVWVSVWVDVVHVACFLATTCTVTSRTSASPSSSACGIFARGFVLGFDTRRKLHAGRSGSRNALYILVIKWHVLSERHSHTMLGSGVTTPRVAKKTLRDVCWLSRLVTTKI